jgi:hypothetical protein
MSLLASPRRRRRVAWLVGTVACVGLITAVVILVPGRSAPATRTRPTLPQFGATTSETPAFTTTVSATEERARERAEAAVRPLANLFVNAMIRHRNFEKAHALLTPQFQTGSVGDWQLAQHLPLELGKEGSLGSTTIAYSGPAEVGLIVSVSTPGDTDGHLVALRFDKRGSQWLIDYIHQGRSSTRVDPTNYSPAGFLPGTHRETAWTWLILIGGLVGIIAVVALADWWLSRTRPAAD